MPLLSTKTKCILNAEEMLYLFVKIKLVNKITKRTSYALLFYLLCCILAKGRSCVFI